MAQAHDSVLVLEWAGFHDGDGQHLDESAADGTYDHADHHEREGIGGSSGITAKPVSPKSQVNSETTTLLVDK